MNLETVIHFINCWNLVEQDDQKKLLLKNCNREGLYIVAQMKLHEHVYN